MAKKVSKRIVEQKGKKTKKSVQPAENSQDTQNEPNDYGGFPDRDLKKNLGCG